MLAKYIIFCVGLSLQYQLISTSESCQKKITCQECISDPSICVWCAEASIENPTRVHRSASKKDRWILNSALTAEQLKIQCATNNHPRIRRLRDDQSKKNDFNGTTRCMPQRSVENSWCPKFLQNPQNVRLPSENENFSTVSEHIIQIKPQRYKLKLRQGMPESFNFSFKGAQDYPVDLYFLLDASRTMENIKNMTAEQGQKIYLAIKEMTNNVHLGFGTFIDKRMLPIMSNTDDPELTYSFRHRLKLVGDFKQFKEEVSKSSSGVSRDAQEGGLDALAQVLVCNDIIGWRNESRKIVVFLTDGAYHAAGDGKSAGLFEPYDGQCYTENATYTKELEMDYPSVGMINKLAAERDIIIIFLVDSRVSTIYDELKKVVSGSHVAKFFRNKPMKNDAIVTILKDIYENISKKIKLIAKVKSGSKKHLKISFDPDCTTDNNNPACDVENGKELHLKGTVQYDSAESAVVDIMVEGIREKLTLDIDAIRNCDCERDVEINSTFCYGDKRLCGICSCSENRYGDKCGCVKSEKNGYKDNSTCIAKGSTDVCGGHGSCICGTCECRERYNGKFCQCNMDSCPRSTWSSPESVCGGPEHGECDCGEKCKCSADWSGDACDCYKPDTYCKVYNSSSVCNDRGQCVCGECQCDPIAEWDARNSQTKKCQISPCTDCHERQCGKLKSCAKCQRTGNEDCRSCNERMTVKVVESLTEEYTNSSLWNLCSNVKVEIGCQTSFVYRYIDTHYSVELVVAKEKDCAPSYILFGGIFLMTLLLVGAGTLIAWKLLTDARDRHEYLKFTQQSKADALGPSTNPLYETPTTTFNNPAFRKRSVDIR